MPLGFANQTLYNIYQSVSLVPIGYTNLSLYRPLMLSFFRPEAVVNAVRHELYVSYINVLNVDCIVSLILLIVILMFVDSRFERRFFEANRQLNRQ